MCSSPKALVVAVVRELADSAALRDREGVEGAVEGVDDVDDVTGVAVPEEEGVDLLCLDDSFSFLLCVCSVSFVCAAVLVAKCVSCVACGVRSCIVCVPFCLSSLLCPSLEVK